MKSIASNASIFQTSLASEQAAAPAEAVILLGRGMPRGEQEVLLDKLARELMAHDPRRRVVSAFLEMTAPSLEDTIVKLADEGATRIVVTPAFVPWIATSSAGCRAIWRIGRVSAGLPLKW